MGINTMPHGLDGRGTQPLAIDTRGIVRSGSSYGGGERYRPFRGVDPGAIDFL